MSKEYKSFEDLRKKVFNEYQTLNAVDREYLNEKGKFMYEVYDTLDDCFRFSDSKEELVEVISKEIVDLLKVRWYRSFEKEEEDKKIAEKLRRYVRWNIEKELWENIPEFADRKEN